MLYLVCYDITHNRRRSKVAHLLEGYGIRVQKSVFECILEKPQYVLLMRKLEKYLKAEEDQVRFYPMTVHTRRKVLIVGLQPPYRVDDDSFIV